jgi:hypothetical protein
MTKSPANSADKNKLRTYESSSEKSSELARYSTNQFDQVFERMIDAVGGKRAADLAGALGISQASVSGAKRRNNIPDSWYLIIADKYGVSSDWLRTGEGEKRRAASVVLPTGAGKSLAGIVAATTAMAEMQAASDASLIDPSSQNPNIADLVAKTIEVLQSKTVFQTALESNIEAFHHAIVLESKIDQVEDRIMEKVSKRFDELEITTQQLGEANAELREENEKLRKELEQSRAGSALSDTG